MIQEVHLGVVDHLHALYLDLLQQIVVDHLLQDSDANMIPKIHPSQGLYLLNGAKDRHPLHDHHREDALDRHLFKEEEMIQDLLPQEEEEDLCPLPDLLRDDDTQNLRQDAVQETHRLLLDGKDLLLHLDLLLDKEDGTLMIKMDAKFCAAYVIAKRINDDIAKILIQIK